MTTPAAEPAAATSPPPAPQPRNTWGLTHGLAVAAGLLLGAMLPIGSAILNLPGHLWNQAWSWVGDDVHYDSRGPVVERLENLRDLTVMRFPIVDVMTARGFNVEAAWVLMGEGIVSLDIEKAVVERWDAETKELRLALPVPRVISARLDMEDTKLIHAGKLWPVPMVGDEASLHKDAMRQGERLIARGAADYPHHRQSKQNAEAAIRDLFRAAEIDVTVVWIE